jgi:DNA-binding CsgD family transcriptional regulator
MIEEDDRSKIITFFQRVKSYQSSNYEWLLTTSKFLKNRKESISISQELNGIDSSFGAISRVLEDNLYIRKNMAKFGSLTKREKQVIKLVARGFTSKQIAEELFLSLETVKTHRKNINKKLDLKRCIDWEYFANAFDI